MESFITEDGSVAKFIHADGSETAVKVVKSCSNLRDSDGRLLTERVDRGNYSVFISSSLGCYMKCPFCHLTIKDSAYRKLDAERVEANVREAIAAEAARRPEIRERHGKLCWMGMGDALNQPAMVRDVTLRLMDWILENGYARGLDCVDLSTVMPRVGDEWISAFAELNERLRAYPQNPKSFLVEQAEIATRSEYDRRTPFRLFYSLHSALAPTRERMVPNATPLPEAIPKLLALRERGVNVLLHQLFVEGLNDSSAEVDALLDLLGAHFPDLELRVLRYNFCDRSPYREWSSIDEALSRVADAHARLKVQISAGSEVSAACGQFLVAVPKSVSRRAVAPSPLDRIDHKPVLRGGSPGSSDASS